MLEDEVWYVADAIPPGTSAAVAILEHRWAIPLRDAIEAAGGQALADAWLHPSDLVDARRAPPGAAGGGQPDVTVRYSSSPQLRARATASERQATPNFR